MVKNHAVLTKLLVVLGVALPLTLGHAATTATSAANSLYLPQLASSENLTPPTTSGSSSVYWGAYIDGVPWDMTKLAAFETDAQKKVAIVHWGQSWVHNGAYQPFYPNDFNAVRTHGSIPMLDWSSDNYSLGPTQPAFKLTAITSGLYDGYILQWAQAAQAWGHPLFLRFDWEMNGNWHFPWSTQLNGNVTADYVPAWQHVHDIFTRAGATNVLWVWSPNVVYTGSTPLAALYPGNAYVDWVAMDGYNWGTDKSMGWQSFADVFGATYKQLLQLAPTKPIMLAEVASSEHGGSKAAWIADAIQTQVPNNFRRIKAVVWFNWNAGDPTLTWPIESSPAATSAFATAIALPVYASNQFGQ